MSWRVQVQGKVAGFLTDHQVSYIRGRGTLEEAMQAAIARLQAIFREELTKEPSDVVFLGAIKVVGPEGLMLRPNGKQPKQTGALPRTTKRSS